MKKCKLIIFIFLMMISLGILCSCNNDNEESHAEHTHDYGAIYYKDLSNHWKECSCGEKGNISEHSYGNWITITEATEDSVGSKKQVCITCGYENIVEIPKLEHVHNFNVKEENENTLKEEATCTENEVYYYSCRCNEISNELTYEKEDSTLGHKTSPAVEENKVASTCKVAGLYDSVVYCSECNKELSRETVALPLAEHKEETVPGKQATCTETGLTEGKRCGVCESVLIEQTVISKLEHNYREVITNSTYETEGYTTYSCLSCDYEYIGNYTDKLGYTIKFNVNGGQNTVENQIKYKNQSIELTTTIPIRNGYVFVGWNSILEDTIYQPGDLFSLDSDIEFWAMWKKICEVCNNERYLIKEEDCDNCNYAVNGTYMEGMECSNCGTSSGFVVINGIGDVCSRCYSRYNKIYIGHYIKCSNCNGKGKLVHKNKCTNCNKLEYGLAPTLKNNSYRSVELVAIEGYEYSIDGENWQNSNIFNNLTPNTQYSFYQRIATNGNVPFGVTSDKLSVKTLEILNYAITYNLDGGTNSSMNPTKFTVEDEFDLQEPTKLGYNFEGWFDNNGNKIERINLNTKQNFTLTAKWILLFEINDGVLISYNKSLDFKQIVIPDDVTSIASYAFNECLELESIIIPSSVTSIGKAAFYKCNNLQSISIPFLGGSLDDTDNAYFGYIFGAGSWLSNGSYVPSGLKEVIITGGTSIGEDAFWDCSSLTSIEIPSSVTCISDGAFNDCSSLTSFRYYYSEKNKETFSNVKYLVTEIIVCDGVTSIGSYTFSGCTSLTSVTFEEESKLENIGYSAFEYCSSLTNIEIPNGVTSIDGSAFSYCSSLTSVTIPDSVISIGDSAFDYCYNLESVKFEEGSKLESIGYGAFCDCSSLTSITIPDSVTSIGSDAFEGCSSLTSITIPDSVTSIGDWAFSSCSSLTIYCEASSKPSEWDSEWNSSNRPVYWAGQWEYDDNGNPVPLS